MRRLLTYSGQLAANTGMIVKILLAIVLLALSTALCAQAPTTVDTNQVEIAPYRHKTLPPALLTRIRALTDTFESVDGISYEQAIDLYRRDVNPEDGLVLYEEMARAYRQFCAARCAAKNEKVEVYQLLLLRTMFPSEQAVARMTLHVLSAAEARSVVGLYSLPAKPIPVYKTE